MKKRKKRKDICYNCKCKMKVQYEDCPFCGGGEYYECPKCMRIFDLETGEEL